jgi:hypothetical protein
MIFDIDRDKMEKFKGESTMYNYTFPGDGYNDNIEKYEVIQD